MTEVQDILLLLGAFGSECVTPQSNMLLIGNSDDDDIAMSMLFVAFYAIMVALHLEFQWS